VWSPYSREGWHVIEDSQTTLLDADDWVTNDTSAAASDLYFFGHGASFRGAIQDLSLVSGKHPLLPKYSLGVMWSRWYDLSFHDVRFLVDEGYSSRSMPLDLFVLDMDWHAIYKGVGQEWTGWTFDRNLFQEPDDYFAWLRHRNLAASLNIHDADGVSPTDLRYPAMAAALGMDPAGNTTIQAWFDDKDYIQALEDIMLRPFQDGSGHRFAIWRDWQQGGHTCVRTRGLNPTIWLNHMSVTDPYRRGENWRGWTLARYGGIGSQRYPTGFSGDVQHDWTSLQFQVYFTTTAASVSFQWSNDIVPAQGSGNNEMHTRWIQWGAFSPHFRSHDAGSGVGNCADLFGCALIEPWDAPKDFLDANRAALAMRQALTPTWYTLNRVAYDTGLVPVRPMYLGWPQEEAAYSQLVRNQQYTIGEDITVSPITAPRDTTSLISNWTVWLPPGQWYDEVTGRLWNTSQLTAPANVSSAYDISEVPRAVRSGAVIARMPYDPTDVIAVARRNYTHLVFDVYPGDEASGTADVYEDDGESLDYVTGSFAVTTARYTRSGSASASTTTVAVSTNGSYPGLPASRAYSVRLVMSYPPTAVTVAGRPVPYSRFGCDASSRDPARIQSCWSYDGNTLTTTVTAAGVVTADGGTIAVTSRSWAPACNSPLNGARGAIQRAQLVKRTVIDPALRPGNVKSDLYHLQWLSSAGDALSFQAGPSGNATAFDATLTAVTQALESTVKQLKALSPLAIDENRTVRASALMRTAWAGWNGVIG